jgi:glycerate 2-kinase
MVAFFGSSLQMGIETVLDTVGFDKQIKDADFVFTGEGKLDSQSLRGKAVIGIARRVRSCRSTAKVIAFVGDIGDDISQCYEEGVTAVFSINRVCIPFSEARKRAESDLELTVENFIRLIEKI